MGNTGVAGSSCIPDRTFHVIGMALNFVDILDPDPSLDTVLDLDNHQ